MVSFFSDCCKSFGCCIVVLAVVTLLSVQVHADGPGGGTAPGCDGAICSVDCEMAAGAATNITEARAVCSPRNCNDPGGTCDSCKCVPFSNQGVWWCWCL